MEYLKTVFSDFFNALKSKRVVTTISAAILTVLAAKYEWIPTDRIDDIATFVAALIVGDSLRPTNPEKLGD
jgi:hypothetical protein